MNNKLFFINKINQLNKFNFTALNDKKLCQCTTKINTAIIINFIYYRHSVLNVCLPPIRTECSAFGFFLPLFW